MSSKSCSKCGTEKPLSEFHKHCGISSGFRAQCKICVNADNKSHQAKPHSKIARRLAAQSAARKAHKKEYAARPENRKKTTEAAKQWGIQYPERIAAIRAVNNAVRDNRLTRWPCWVCGANAEAHHPAYSLPLDVVWLCRPHHREVHSP